MRTCTKSIILSILIIQSYSIRLANQNKICSKATSSFWKSLRHSLFSGNGSYLDEYHEFISPLANITKLTYTGKFAEEAVQGFDLVLPLTPKVGLNALAYRSMNADLGKEVVIISFRGTTTESDRCADRLLWRPEEPLPLWCRQYGRDSLDYVRQAEAFVSQIKQRLPDHHIIYSGHSLGAALSEMFSLASNGTSPSVCFASAGAKGPAKRHGFLTDKSDLSCAIQIVHPYDPVVESSKVDQLGVKCIYQNIPEPKPCLLYDHGRNPFFFEECFEKAHLFINYLRLLAVPEVPACTTSINSYKSFFLSEL